MRWLVPRPIDLKTVMSGIVNTSATEEDRQQLLIDAVVMRVRGAILTSGRYGLSLTKGSVPPSGFQHTLVLTVWALVASTPTLAFTTKENFTEMYKAAEKWLADVALGPPKGVGVEIADDVDPDTAPVGVNWGSESPHADMATV